MTPSRRIGRVQRQTKETSITLQLDLDGSAKSQVKSGIGFLDHLLETLARHARFDLMLDCSGDLHVDDHHTAEDCGIALGQAIDQALGDRGGILRFGSAYAPLDEALVRTVVDLSGRPGGWINLPLRRESIGGLSCENVSHVIRSLAIAGRMTLHMDLIRGDNAHHSAEAAFKSLALALRGAVARDGSAEVPSTKGTLS